MRIFVHLETKIDDHQTLTIIILQKFQAPIVYTANSRINCNSKI